MSASDELVVAEAHDAEVGLERGERVVGDLGLRRAHRRDQRGLPGVREPDERGVGQQLHLEPQPVLLAVLALLGEAGRAPRVREEPGVAAAAPAAAGGEVAVAVAHEVGEQLAVAGLHLRALGHRHDEVGRRSRRGACCPSRACPTRPAGAGGRGTRAATRRCGRPARRCRRPSRRHRRRARPWARAPRAGTTPRPRRRRRRAG